MTKLSKKSLWQISRNVWKKTQEDELFGRAAELSFYFLFALFPMLIFLTTLFGYLAGSGTELHYEVLTGAGSYSSRVGACTGWRNVWRDY